MHLPGAGRELSRPALIVYQKESYMNTQPRYTYQQARAALVRTAIHSYSRSELAHRLHLVAPQVQVPHTCSILSIAYKLAWQLLPAGCDRSGT